MKTIIHIASCVFLLILLTISCQNESIQQDCSGDNAQSLQTFYSDELTNVPCSLQNIESTEKEVNVVIANQADLEKYFTCAGQLSEIDFEKYIILAGRYRHHQCAIFDNQQIVLCNSKVVYRVWLLEQDCLAVMSVFYATVIEKKYSDLSIEFDVQFKK